MDPTRGRRTVSPLAPALGLIVGAALGLLLGALDVLHIAWGLVGGAALGLIAGAAVAAMSKDS